LKWPHLAPALVHIGAIYAPNILRELRDLVFRCLEGWEVQSLSPDKALMRWLLEPRAVGRDARWYELFVGLQEKLVAAQNRGEILITVATGLSTAEQLMAGVLLNTRSLVAHAWEWAAPLDFAQNAVWAAGKWWLVVTVEWVETGERALPGPPPNKVDAAQRRGGRKRGSGAIEDTPRLLDMLDLLDKGQARSVHDAACKIAKSMVETSQSRVADISRLRGKFARAYGTEPPAGKTWGDVAAELKGN
jgi:hypothetical protein